MVEASTGDTISVLTVRSLLEQARIPYSVGLSDGLSSAYIVVDKKFRKAALDLLNSQAPPSAFSLKFAGREQGHLNLGWSSVVRGRTTVAALEADKGLPQAMQAVLRNKLWPFGPKEPVFIAAVAQRYYIYGGCRRVAFDVHVKTAKFDDIFEYVPGQGPGGLASLGPIGVARTIRAPSPIWEMPTGPLAGIAEESPPGKSVIRQ